MADKLSAGGGPASSALPDPGRTHPRPNPPPSWGGLMATHRARRARCDLAVIPSAPPPSRRCAPLPSPSMGEGSGMGVGSRPLKGRAQEAVPPHPRFRTRGGPTPAQTLPHRGGGLMATHRARRARCDLAVITSAPPLFRRCAPLPSPSMGEGSGMGGGSAVPDEEGAGGGPPHPPIRARGGPTPTQTLPHRGGGLMAPPPPQFWTSRSNVPSGSTRYPTRTPEGSSRGGCRRGQPVVVSGRPAARQTA
jgi:hypothetical protein